MNPQSELSPEARNRVDSMCMVALAHYCADLDPQSEQFKIAREIGVAISTKHLGEHGESHFEKHFLAQREKIKRRIIEASFRLLAKTIERNGGCGTLPKSQSVVA